MPVAGSIKTTEKVKLTISPKDVDLKPAVLDGVATWEIANAGIEIKLTAAVDGLSAYVEAPDALDPDPAKNVGTVTVKGKGAGDLEDTAVITVTEAGGGAAVSLGLEMGVPEPK